MRIVIELRHCQVRILLKDAIDVLHRDADGGNLPMEGLNCFSDSGIFCVEVVESSKC